MRGAGRAIFAATLLILAGTVNIIYGIGALGDANIFHGGQRFVFTTLLRTKVGLFAVFAVSVTRVALAPCAGTECAQHREVVRDLLGLGIDLRGHLLCDVHPVVLEGEVEDRLRVVGVLDDILEVLRLPQ